MPAGTRAEDAEAVRVYAVLTGMSPDKVSTGIEY